jgi:hypothetical protein
LLGDYCNGVCTFASLVFACLNEVGMLLTADNSDE